MKPCYVCSKPFTSAQLYVKTTRGGVEGPMICAECWAHVLLMGASRVP